MASVYDNIRAALEVKLEGIAGIPSIAWENVSFTRTTGESYVQPRLVPTVREPAHRGLNPQMYYQGLFRVDCYVPEGAGPKAADDLANLIIENFEATTDLSSGGTNVSIRYAEREQGISDGAFFMVPVNVGFYTYSS